MLLYSWSLLTKKQWFRRNYLEMSDFYFASVREILEIGSYNGKLLFQNKTSKSDIYKQITVFLNNSLIIILKMDFLSIFARASRHVKFY